MCIILRNRFTLILVNFLRKQLLGENLIFILFYINLFYILLYNTHFEIQNAHYKFLSTKICNDILII